MNHIFPVMLVLFMVFTSTLTKADEQVVLLAPPVPTILSPALTDLKIPSIKKVSQLQINVASFYNINIPVIITRWEVEVEREMPGHKIVEADLRQQVAQYPR